MPPPDAAADFAIPVQVYWEDTDAGGIVYYANYLRYFERARSDWLRHEGISQQALRESDGALFVVADVQLKYHQPARLDDRLTVTARLAEAGRASWVFAQAARRGADLLCEARVRVGCVDAASLKPRRMPAAVARLTPARP